MQLHQLKPIHKFKKKKRIGRGGKRGTYSGRGIKGQKARAGRKIRPEIRDFIKKIPKKRGYKFKAQSKPQIVNLKDLEKHYKEGEVVSPETLFKKGLIVKVKGRTPKQVKILGKGLVRRSSKSEGGKLTKKLEFKDCKLSKSVKKYEMAK
jgi:large subunit ribosomal protein L15